jgi:hypothetical protein
MCPGTTYSYDTTIALMKGGWTGKMKGGSYVGGQMPGPCQDGV